MNEYVWETAEEINAALAERVRSIRKRRGISQQKLSEESGVSYGSVKRFESTGQISLLSLTRLAMALDCTDEIKKLFADIPYLTMEEVLRERK